MTSLCTTEMKEAERMPAMMGYLQENMHQVVYVYRLRFMEDDYILERHELSDKPEIRKRHLGMMGTALAVYMSTEDDARKALNALFLDDFPLSEVPPDALEDV